MHSPLFCMIKKNWRGLKASKMSLVSSPDQIFRVRLADSLKNRVWTLSLRKLGQVYIWQVVNVGVNYIIRDQQRLLWRQKNLQAGNSLYLSNLIGLTTCQYARIFTSQFFQ